MVGITMQQTTKNNGKNEQLQCKIHYNNNEHQTQTTTMKNHWMITINNYNTQ